MKLAIPTGFRPRFIVLVTVLTIIAGTITAAILYYGEHKSALKEEVWRDLGTIADLQVRQIVGWRDERLAEGRFLLHLDGVASSTGALINGERAGSALIRELLESIRETRPPSDAGILDPDFRVVWSAAGANLPVTGQTAANARECLARREVVISDLQTDDANRIHLETLVPVFDEAGGAMAVLLLRHDASDALPALTKSWPEPSQSQTGESLLVGSEDGRVVFLSDSRLGKNQSLAHSAAGWDSLPAQAAAGVEGMFEGTDYQGEPVLGVARRIGDSQWLLVAKVDQSESYATIAHMARETAVQAALLVLSLSLSASLLFSRRIQRVREAEVNKAREQLESRVHERTDQLRRLTEYMDATREAEAKKISEAIHEDIGASLTAARLRLQTVRERLRRMGSEEVRHLDVATNLLDDVLHDVRRIAHGLRPSLLDHLGLRAAVEGLVEEFENYTQIECKVLVQTGDYDASRTTIEVYRILQEALTNVARHADASLVHIKAWDDGANFHLEVIDNGKGISEEVLRGNSGGLLSIRERALRLGGRIDITALQPHGTRVYASLPITKRLAEEPLESLLEGVKL